MKQLDRHVDSCPLDQVVDGEIYAQAVKPETAWLHSELLKKIDARPERWDGIGRYVSALHLVDGALVHFLLWTVPKVPNPVSSSSAESQSVQQHP